MTIRRNTSEIERSRAGMLRAVRVAQVDPEKARVKVFLKEPEGDDTDGAKSAWLPLINSRAGGNRAWHLPDEGEQMMLFAPDGNTESAVLLGGIYSKHGEQPSTDPDLDLMAYADGATTSYHRGDHAYGVSVPDEAGSVRINAGASIAATAGSAISLDSGGNISLTADTNISAEAQTVTVDAQTVTVTAQSVTITAPLITLNGNVIINGNLVVNGSISSSGGMSVASDLEVQGNAIMHADATIDGDATIGGISFLAHEHGGVVSGGDTSDAPVGAP